jgi:multidrug efflux system membrane fusion protein
MSRITLLIFVALVLAACDQAPPVVADHVELVRVVEARQGRLQHQLSFHGVLVPVTRARLAFQSPGVLATRPVQLGQVVRQGELLATLDNPDLGPAQRAASARLQESLSQRDQAERDLARLRSLESTGAVGEEQVEQKAALLSSLQATVARAEADLTGTRQRLEDAALLAPFDGVISLLNVEPGEFVSAGQPVMAVGGLDKVEVRVLLPASLVSELHIGDDLAVRIPQLRGLEVSGVVTELAAIGELETGLFPVVVELETDPATTMLRAGMQAEVILNYADVEGLIVPLSAIVDPVGGNPKVFTVADNHARQTAVRIMAIAREEVALEMVRGGIVPGDLVVVAGHRSLSDGQGVRLLQ